MKRDLCKHQQQQIKSLEDLIDYLHDSFTHIVKLSDQLESNLHRSSVVADFMFPKAIILKPFTPRPSSTNKRSKNLKTFGDHCEKISEHSICGSYIDSESQEPLTIRSKALETSLEMQRLYNNELKKSNELNKEQASTYQKLLNEFEQRILTAQKLERERWKQYFNELKSNYEKELARKQQEVLDLNKLLGDWINKYMELQETIQADKPLSYTSYNEISALITQTLFIKNAEKPKGLKLKLLDCPAQQSLTSPRGLNYKPGGDKNPL